MRRGDGWGMPNPKNSGNNKPLESRSKGKKSKPRKSPRQAASKPNSARPPKRGGTFQKNTGEPSQKLRASILRQISHRPLDAAGIASALDLPPAWKGKLLQLLKEMETAGDIARIRRDRYIIPKEAEKSGARVTQAPSETLSNNKIRAGFSADISMISWRVICNNFQRKG